MPQRTFVWLVCGAWLLALGCVGQRPPRAPSAEVAEYPLSSFILPNGLSVVLEQSADAGAAGAVLVVGTGSADEAPTQAGLAHLLEHLVFHSHGADELELRQRLDLHGGTWNAWTGWDTTTFVSYCPAAAIEPLLGLLAGVLDHPLLGVGEDQLAHELDIVENERRRSTENGTPGQMIGWLAASVFPESFGYAHPVAGTRESIPSLRLADVAAFAGAGYVPARSTLAVSSPLDLAAQRALVERAFASLPAAAAPQPRPLIAEAPMLREGPREGPVVYSALVANPTLYVGWSVPSGLSSQGAAVPLLVRMINGAFVQTDRVHGVVRVSTGCLEGARSDLFYLEVTLVDAQQAAAALDWVLERMRQGLTWAQPYFVRDQRNAAVEETYALEALTFRTPALARSQYFTGDPRRLERRDRRLLALRPDAVESYARSYLSDQRARAIVVVPSESDLGGARSRAHLAPGAAAAELRKPPELFTDAELQHWIDPFEQRGIVSRKLGNGLTVIVQKRPASTYHTLLLGFAGGEAAGEVPGVSIAEPWALIQDEWELSVQGLLNRRYHTADSTVETVRSTGSDITLSLKALRSHLEGTTVVWPPRRFLERVESYERQDALPPNQLARELADALYGANPYGRRPTAAQVHAVRPNQIYRFRSSTQRPENGVLIIVGNVEPESAFAAARDSLGSWQASDQRGAPLPVPPLSVALAPRQLVRDWPGSTHAQIGLSCLVDASDPDRVATLNMLGHLIRSRLDWRLRDQLGASYSVLWYAHLLRGGTGQLDVVADVSYEALTAASEQLDHFIHGGAVFDSADLQQARRGYAASYSLKHSTSVGVALALGNNWLLGFPADEISREPQRFFAVTPERVNQLAAYCGEHAVTTLLADRSRSTPLERAARR